MKSIYYRILALGTGLLAVFAFFIRSDDYSVFYHFLIMSLLFTIIANQKENEAENKNHEKDTRRE